jgi:hypothetical protein
MQNGSYVYSLRCGPITLTGKLIQNVAGTGEGTAAIICVLTPFKQYLETELEIAPGMLVGRKSMCDCLQGAISLNYQVPAQSPSLELTSSLQRLLESLVYPVLALF